MRTLGIDLSADPSRTGACLVDWERGTVELLGRPASDDDLVAAISGADLTGVDVPLGWPDSFVAAVVAHHDGNGWPPADVDPPADREPLRFRLTDVLTRGGGARPLSVSTDLIGVAAMRGARLQHLLGVAGVAVDRSGTAGRIAEVYPAAALRSWGMVSSGYKGGTNRAVRAELVTALVRRCGPIADAAEACLEQCDDDSLDGFVCALVARAVLLGASTRPDHDQLDLARREGWIHVPTAPPEDIIAG